MTEYLPELRARRMYAQLLGRPATSPLEAARWMLATQGQLYGSGVTALAVRSTSGAEVLGAVDKHQIVRTWSQRGTHHFVAAEDARWLMRLCHPRPEAAAAKRRPGLGLTPEMFDTAQGVLFDALTDGPVTRKAAYGLFDVAGVDAGGGRGPHILRSLGSMGDIVQGPRDGNEDVFMLVDHLPGELRDLEGDEALAELGTRYFASHGPATVKDLAWWSGLTMTEAKKAAALARDVVEVEYASTAYFMGSYQDSVSVADVLEHLNTSYELPAFDEYLLGYGDRAAVCAPEFVSIVGPTKNGMCRPFRLVDGQVAGGLDSDVGSA